MTRTHRPPTFWRAAGPWLVLASAGYLLVNVLRVFLDEAGFARYFGLPLADGGDSGWTYVYASRTALLAGVALILLVRRELRLLSLYAALSVIGPGSDAITAANHDAAAGTIIRHVLTGVFLLLVAGLLARQHRLLSQAGGTDR